MLYHHDQAAVVMLWYIVGVGEEGRDKILTLDGDESE